MLNIAFFDTTTFSLPRIDLGKIWSLLKVVEKPRFTYVRSIQDKNKDPREPVWLGDVFCDQKTGKEYFVVSELFEEDGKKHKNLSSIQEIISSSGLSHRMTKDELKAAMPVKTPDVDVENDMADYFKGVCVTSGRIFHDLRERNHGTGTKEAAQLKPSLN